jgi:quercetin dioxygenase-like cupin family protein
MTERSKKRGVSIYTAAAAAENPNITKLTDEQKIPLALVSEPIGKGMATKVLVADAGGFGLKHVWLKPNFPLPRHSHAPGDCLYYVIAGELRMGNQLLRGGDSFLVPSGAPYQYTAGPEGVEVLEIRYRCTEVDMTVLEDPERYRQRAYDALDANRAVWAEAVVPPTFATAP